MSIHQKNMKANFALTFYLMISLSLTFEVFCQVTEQSEEISNSMVSLKKSDEHQIEFYLNISSLIRKVNRIIFIDVKGSENDSHIFANDLLAYLHAFSAASFVSLNSNMMILNGTRLVDDLKLLQQMIAFKQIIFILYDSFEEFYEAIRSSKWSAFKQSPRSYFVITILCNEIKDVSCSSSYEDALRVSIGDVFKSVWTIHRILETIIYLPFVCGKQVILKYDPIVCDAEDNPFIGTTIINKEDIEYNPDVILHSYKQLNGYPLEVKLFGRVPTSVRNISKALLDTYLKTDIARAGYVAGIDGFTLGNLAKFLNVSAKISESADGYEYGFNMGNGSFAGTIGDVITRRADISFNARFMKMYNTEDIEFTTPIYHDNFCVLVPKAQIIPAWRNIFMGFSTTAWYMIIVTATISGILWWLMKLASDEKDTVNNGSFPFCIHFMDMCLLIASQPIFLPTLGRERVFVAGCLIFNIIFCGVFQGYLNTAYSTTSHYPDINTLESLDESGLPIATSSRLDDIFGTGVSQLLTNLQKKVKSIKTAAIDRAAADRDVAAVERRSDARLLIELKYLASDGEPLLHVVNECPRSYYLSYIVYKGYPFLPHINKFIRRIIESGLNDQWYDFTMYSIILNHRSQNQISSESLKKLTMVDVQTAFFALVFGLSSSLGVFICELSCYCLKKKKINTNTLRNTSENNHIIYLMPKDIPKYKYAH